MGFCCREIRDTSAARRKIALKNGAWALSHRNFCYDDIFDAYDKPSRDKILAWEYCKNLCERLNGWNLIISSKNTYQFSAVFEFVDYETGVLSVAYITRDYDSFAEQTA